VNASVTTAVGALPPVEPDKGALKMLPESLQKTPVALTARPLCDPIGSGAIFGAPAPQTPLAHVAPRGHALPQAPQLRPSVVMLVSQRSWPWRQLAYPVAQAKGPENSARHPGPRVPKATASSVQATTAPAPSRLVPTERMTFKSTTKFALQSCPSSNSVLVLELRARRFRPLCSLAPHAPPAERGQCILKKARASNCPNSVY